MLEIKKKVVESSSFNILTTYSNFILGILSTCIIARLISPEEWALIILTLLFINIIVFICNFFPPAATSTFQYYIPHLSTEGKNAEIRSFIFHVYKIRLFSLVIIYILFIFVVYFANFEIKLLEIILIMSPMFFFSIINTLNSSILLAFQKFKLTSFINISFILINFICLAFIFFFKLEDPLILIGYTYLLSSIISCIVSISFVFPLIPNKNKDNINTSLDKKKFYNIHKNYGMNLIIAGIFSQVGALIINLLFLNFGLIVYITYLAICENIVGFTLKFSSSERSSYISIFSKINSQGDSETFETLFSQIFKYLALFICLIVGFIFFFIEMYISIVYTEIYLVILFAIQIFIFTAFSRIIIRNLMVIAHSTNNTKIQAEIAFILMIGNISFTIIALLYFNFFILILLYTMNSIFSTFIIFFLIKKYTNLKLKLMVIYKPFLIFLMSFLITYPFTLFINFLFISDLALLNLFINSLLKFIIFLIIFYAIIFFTKMITKEDFNLLVDIIPILNSKKKIIQKMVIILEKFFPSKK